MPRVPERVRDALPIVGYAALCEACLGGVDVALTGALGMGAPLAGMALGVTVGLVVRVRADRKWLTRVRLRRLAVDVGLGHFGWVGLAYGIGASVSGAAWLLGVGALGLLGALAAGAVVMCVGDGVAMVMCPFPDPVDGTEGGGPAGPWRRR